MEIHPPYFGQIYLFNHLGYPQPVEFLEKLARPLPLAYPKSVQVVPLVLVAFHLRGCRSCAGWGHSYDSSAVLVHVPFGGWYLLKLWVILVRVMHTFNRSCGPWYLAEVTFTSTHTKSLSVWLNQLVRLHKLLIRWTIGLIMMFSILHWCQKLNDLYL